MTTPTQTNIPCPDWCQEHLAHTGELESVHSATYHGCDCMYATVERWDEQPFDQGPVLRGHPQIHLVIADQPWARINDDQQGDALTVEEARALACALNAAVAQADEIARA